MIDHQEIVGISEIRRAQTVLANQIRRTPIGSSQLLSRRFGLELFFKQEIFQKTGAFKVRGVLNKLHFMSPEEQSRGVIALSTGNHAQALAWSASRIGIRSTIVMPVNSAQSKIEATKGYGGEVVLTDRDLIQVSHEIQEKRKMTMVHPYDDPHVIAGQGTMGIEIFKDLPRIETIIVSVGGGGMLAGVATAIKNLSPQTRIVGVEPVGASSMYDSLKAKRVITPTTIDTVADGLAAPSAGDLTYQIISRLVDEFVIVSDAMIVKSMVMLLEYSKILVEPAAAATLAVILDQKIKFRKDERVLCLLCGGNIDMRILKELL